MRLAVDEKEMDEIHMEDEDEHIETARRVMLSDAGPPPVVEPVSDPFSPPPIAANPPPEPQPIPEPKPAADPPPPDGFQLPGDPAR